MLKNHLTLALRSLRKRLFFTGINVLGLAVGTACCLLIVVYVYHEWSYDRFHEKAGRIYRVVQEQHLDAVREIAVTGGTLGPSLQEAIPEIEASVRMAAAPNATVRHGSDVFFDQRMLQADARLLDVFTFPLRSGDAATALKDPFTMVLTESTARRYFGDEDPVGRTLSLEIWSGPTDYTVTGVVADAPSNSHLQFEGILSFATIEATRPQALEGGSMFWTYVLLHSDADAAAMPPRLDRYIEQRWGAEALQHMRYRLQPITDIHLRSNVQFDIHQGRSADVVYILAIIAGLVLLLACINYMNLSTARAGDRAREVGVRKVVGAQRSGLVGQFLTESIVMVVVAMVFALCLAWLAFPAFASLTGTAVQRAMLFNGPVLLLVGGVAVLVGVLAGSYPAFVLSSFRPVRVLKGELTRSAHGAWFRRGLVVLQFTITIALLTAMAVTFRQLDYAYEKDLGFDQDDVIMVPVHGGPAQLDRLRTAWAALPGVAGITADSRRSPDGSGLRYVHREGRDSSVVEIRYFFVEDNFVDLLDIEMAAGRDFSAAFAGDSADAAVINEAAARVFGWASAEEALGQRLRFGPRVWEIIGVTRDFHHQSLHQAVEPLLLQWRPGFLQQLLVRLHPDRGRQTLDAMAAAWTRVEPERPFTYAFMDDALARLYEDDRQLGRLFGFFAGLAVLIACLGLLGLAAFAAEQRTKEIGVRKVLGASAGSIVVLLSKEFVALVALAFAVATPLAYLGMERWLSGFAYRVDLRWSEFLVAGMLALLVALLTVSYQSLRAALANPVGALRYE